MSGLLAYGSLGSRTAGLLVLIETPDAMEGYLLRAQSQDDAKRRVQRCITALQEARCLTATRLTFVALQRQDPLGAVLRIRSHLPERLGSPRMDAEKRKYHCMREVLFRVEVERLGHLEAQAEGLPIRITAPTMEELQHEAREALIEHLGPSHCTYRVRVRRHQSPAVSAIRPLRRQPLHCA